MESPTKKTIEVTIRQFFIQPRECSKAIKEWRFGSVFLSVKVGFDNTDIVKCDGDFFLIKVRFRLTILHCIQ